MLFRQAIKYTVAILKEDVSMRLMKLFVNMVFVRIHWMEGRTEKRTKEENKGRRKDVSYDNRH